MRPKKVVLLVGADEDLLSRTVFALETWGYRVIRALGQVGAREAIAHEPAGSLHILLLQLPFPGSGEIAREAREHSDLRILQVVCDATLGRDTAAEITMIKPSQAEMRERVRILAQWPRGPKKMPVGAERAVAWSAQAKRLG
jgi:DNA-binding response OmpR family regulator